MLPPSPLVGRLTKHRYRPQRRLDLVLHAVAFISLAIFISLVPTPDEFSGDVLQLLFAATVFTPVYLAFFSARITAQETLSTQYKLLTLTPITDFALACSFVRVVMHRMRTILILTLVAIPILIFLLVMLAQARIVFKEILGPTPVYYNEQPFLSTDDSLFLNARLSNEYPAIFTALLGLLVLGLWGMNLLAIVLGIGIGLWWRHDILSPTGAVIGALVGPTSLLLAVVHLPSKLSDQQVLLIMIALAALTYLLTAVILATGSRFARQN